MVKLFSYPGPFWRVHASLAFIVVVMSVFIWGPLSILVGLTRNRNWTSSMVRAWFKWVFFAFGTKVEFENQSTYKKDDQCLIISNHQSHFDIPTCFIALSGHIRMAAKKELFFIPIFGQCLWVCEFICVDRKNRKKSRKAAKKIGDAIRSGIQVWVAAEGTRTPDGEIKEFKSGTFSTAIEEKISILPLIVVNGFDTFNKSHMLPRTGTTIKIVALEYVSVDGYKPKERKDLALKVHSLMSEELLKQRKLLSQDQH